MCVGGESSFVWDGPASTVSGLNKQVLTLLQGGIYVFTTAYVSISRV